ncbi:uncharacterized protein [Haliaeetus albicilla]|uniref:uncharacterized protein n=1 Tax=Haliaeetus albicilla TaxID=8969 RepID=UPI0037E90A7C
MPCIRHGQHNIFLPKMPCSKVVFLSRTSRREVLLASPRIRPGFARAVLELPPELLQNQDSAPSFQTPLHTVILRSAAERASTELIASASNGPLVAVTPPLNLPPFLLGPPKSPQTLSLAMAVILFLVPALLGIVQSVLRLGEVLHVATHRLMLHLAQQLSWEIIQPLRDMEQIGLVRKVLLLATFQQRCSWASALGAGVLLLLLLLCLCWRTRKRSREPGSTCKQGSPGGEGEEEEEGEVEEDDDDDDDDSGDPGDLGRCVVDHTQWPAPYMADTCKLVEELVDELLSACRRLSGNSFKPRLQPAIGVGCAYEAWTARENNVLYRLLVPLQPPPGHAFCLEPATAKEMLTSDSCLRVQLRCMCMREWLVEDVLCFLHHSEEELKRQGPSLLNTLCTNSYLDIQKTASWFQMLVKNAWELMPQSHHCQLTVLPTARSCKIRLTNGQETLSVQMIFGVPLDDDDGGHGGNSFLSLE